MAGAQHCDLIVMGSHGKTGTGAALGRERGGRGLRKSVCPVMVVKTPACPANRLPIRKRPRIPASSIDVRPLGTALASAHTRTLIRTPAVEVVRLDRPGGPGNPPARGKGEIIVHCLEGRVAFTRSR